MKKFTILLLCLAKVYPNIIDYLYDLVCMCVCMYVSLQVKFSPVKTVFCVTLNTSNGNSQLLQLYNSGS